MTAWTVMLRGIRYRSGRSFVVLMLALVATAAAVLVPAYSRAAQQSVLTDGLRAAPVTGTSVAVGAQGTAASAPAAHSATGDARAAVAAALERRPVLARLLDRPVGGVDVEAVLRPGSGEPLASRLAYRDNVCAHLRLTAGGCPVEPGEVLVSERLAAAHGVEVDGALPIRLGAALAAQPRVMTVVGIYTPKDTTERYWGRTAYFVGGPAVGDAAAERVDAVFTTAEDDVQAEDDALVTMWLDYPLRTAAVRLDDVERLAADLGALDADLSGAELDVDQALTVTLADIDADQRAIGRTVPVIAVPLVLLCWFVLFLLVASLTEERGPEIALAKLRGFPAGRAARFGLGEVLALIVLAAPAGVAAGLGLVELVARLVLAAGTHVEVRWPVFAAAVLALLAACCAAVLAGRRTMRAPVLSLLRRVPERTRWQAGVAEGVVVALAVASLVAAVSDRSAPLALLAPALLAVVAGVVAGRLLGAWARVRLAIARRRGRVPALLSAAQLARRPASQRLVVVVTVAVGLLAFAATAWDVAAQARRERADDTVGATRVYSVTAAHPRALADAVRGADQSGHSMPVVRASIPYADGHVELVGVDSKLLADVAIWRGEERAAVDRFATALRPDLPEPLRIGERVTVSADASGLGTVPVRIGVVVATPGEPPRTVTLGLLTAGSRGYQATLPECRAGCRLLGLAFSRGVSGAAPYQATVRVRSIITGDTPLVARFDVSGGWRVGTNQPPAGISVRPGSALTVSVATAHPGDVVVEYGDSPLTLPAVLAGTAPDDTTPAGTEPGGRTAAVEFDFPGFTEQPQAFTVTGNASRLPRAGTHGLLFDLEYAVRIAERTTSLADSTQLRYEVWAGPEAPDDLGARLAAQGVLVLREDSVTGEEDRLSRRAPALGLRLYLLAGAAAMALAVGVVLLTAYVGADARLYELAALRVTGVRRQLLRRGVLREYAALLGVPLVVGCVVGAAGALLMLPGIPLVTVDRPAGEVDWRPGLGALPVAVGLTGLGLLLTVAVVLRMLRRATPDRLSEGSY